MVLDEVAWHQVLPVGAALALCHMQVHGATWLVLLGAVLSVFVVNTLQHLCPALAAPGEGETVNCLTTHTFPAQLVGLPSCAHSLTYVRHTPLAAGAPR